MTESGQKCFGCYGLKSSSFFSKKEWMKSDNDETRRCKQCRRDSHLKNKKKRDSEAGLTISSPQAVKSQKKDKETKCKICKEVLNRRDDVFCIHCRYVADAVKNKIVLKNLINAIV